jgi:magnesium-transporting ATPase (P-type)
MTVSSVADAALPDVTAGLSAAAAAERLARDGPNSLPSPSQRGTLRQLVDQLTHFFALLLWIAALLAALAGMPQLAVAIAVVVVINGTFAFVQEHRAERAAAALRDLLPRRATVRRDGRLAVIDAADLVVGDVVLLSAGDRISADLQLISIAGLAVDTSTMTGESVPDRPSAGGVALAGTFVLEGEAEAVVTATGGGTELAAVARMTQEGGTRRTPLAIELDRLVRVIATIALGIGVGFFVLALLVGMPAGDGLLFGIGVMVALVPEGLLPTVTLSLAVGAQRMAERHALVRHLESVETLGSTTFICTDKTGTLTRNEMTVVAVWTPRGEVAITDGQGYDPSPALSLAAPVGPHVVDVASVARRCSDGRVECSPDGGWSAVGDPMEAAIDVLARRLGAAEVPPSTQRFPFDPRRRRMSVLHGDTLSVKGAPDAVLDRCTNASGAAAVAERFASAGWRVLAVARREGVPEPSDADADAVERELDLIGLLAFEDPPREAAADAIAGCRRAGISVAMITGDHPATARAIADEVGLRLDGSPVLVGAELPGDEELLAATVDRDGLVVARVRPEDKLRIAAALRRRGHVVAMTGDGVNDGPALHEADIGIAMGRSGTDVARESADLVLLDDDFATVVRAIEQGRSTFNNIRRFLTYHLTDNVAELTPFVVWALSGGRFPLAIGVLQVLALDIGTDLLPALALGAEPPSSGLLSRPPIRGHLVDRVVLRRAFALFGPTEALMAMAAFLATFLAAGWRPGETFPTGDVLLTASGAAFTAVVLGQMATALACRSTRRTIVELGVTGNPLLAGAIGMEVAALAAFLMIAPLARLLEHQPPSIVGLLVAALTFPAIVLVDLLDKRRSIIIRARTVPDARGMLRQR